MQEYPIAGYGARCVYTCFDGAKFRHLAYRDQPGDELSVIPTAWHFELVSDVASRMVTPPILQVLADEAYREALTAYRNQAVDQFAFAMGVQYRWQQANGASALVNIGQLANVHSTNNCAVYLYLS